MTNPWLSQAKENVMKNRNLFAMLPLVAVTMCLLGGNAYAVLIDDFNGADFDSTVTGNCSVSSQAVARNGRDSHQGVC